MNRTARIVAAVFATLLISPCLGFGLFGLLASQEPGVGIGGTIGYIVFELVLLGLIIAGWWAALRRDRKLPWSARPAATTAAARTTARVPSAARPWTDAGRPEANQNAKRKSRASAMKPRWVDRSTAPLWTLSTARS